MIKTARHYKRTTISCFTGIFIQAIIINLTAILFIPMMNLYGLNYIHLGILAGVNFTTQVFSDIIFSGIIDKAGFRKMVLPALFSAFLGLLLFGLSPWIFDNVFTGILIATIIYSAAGGLLEIVLSPIVDAVPNENKGTAMSLLHSFYAWGQVVTILVTTLFIFVFKSENWQIIVFIWSLLPLVNFFMFLASPFPDVPHFSGRKTFRELIRKPFLILAFMAIFFGAATEVIMNQFASTFMEMAMLLPKITGDIFGMAGFAVMLGVGRLIMSKKGGEYSINKVLIKSSILAIICYIIVALSPFPWLTVVACIFTGLAASMLWPGTLIITSERFPGAGSWIFALLAASGDVGAGTGPFLTSYVVEKSLNNGVNQLFTKAYSITSEQAALRIGILFAAIFPIVTLLIHISLNKLRKTDY